MAVVRVTNMLEAIPGYRLIEVIGRGGCGEVWKAEAPGGVLKAVKLVFGTLESALDSEDQVQQELKSLDLMKRIRHPYILGLDRYDIVGGQLLVVTELADRNLWDRFKQCEAEGQAGIPRGELLRYLIEAAEGLDLMNFQYGLQHCDTKPQNFLLVHGHIKVADFGLVRPMKAGKAAVTGVVTPVYAAPEIFEGWASTSSDQYSLAIVYQELLTGRRPFAGTNSRQLFVQHLTAPPDLSSLPAADQAVVGKALSKKPDQRYRSCTDFVRALRGQTVVATRTVPSNAVIQPVTKLDPAKPPVPATNGGVRPDSKAKTAIHVRPPAIAPPKPAVQTAPPASVAAAPRPTSQLGLPSAVAVAVAAPPRLAGPAASSPVSAPVAIAPARPSSQGVPAAAPAVLQPRPSSQGVAPQPAPAVARPSTQAAPPPPAPAPPPPAPPPPPPSAPARRESAPQVMVALECPHCRYQGTVPGTFMGLRVRCPMCHREFAVADAIDTLFVGMPAG